jgi:hypothetical protein
MPLLTEPELERIAKQANDHDPWDIYSSPGTPGDILALVVSHREQGALIKELAEAARHVVMEWRLHGQLTDSCRKLEAALSKVPR